jgi:pimeloyl-ACP methyl ester carboxylesterase
MRHVKTIIEIFVVLVCFLTVSCTHPYQQSSLEGVAEEKGHKKRESPDGGVIHETGVLGPGALYEIWVPPDSDWSNTGRSLVLYVHGYVNPVQQVHLPGDPGDFNDQLLDWGFAIAYSSFSENGWAVKDGAIRTRQLLGYFKGNFGKPGKTYLVGASEGGIISLLLTEKNHNLFDGTLSLCSVVGGAQMEMEYLLSVRLLFDYFFRDLLDTLPDEYGDVPADLDAALGEGALSATAEGTNLPAGGKEFALTVAPTLMALLGSVPADTLAAIALMTVDGEPLFNWPPEMLAPPYPFVPELAATIATTLWYNIFGTEDLLGRTHNHVMVDNTETEYVSLLPGFNNGALNSGIERLAARPDALNYLEHWYQPTGKLRIPVVTLHTTRDPIVPLRHECVFRELVGSTAEKYLAQFEVEGFGHCEVLTVTPSYPYFIPNPDFEYQLPAAFNYLVAWCNTRQKPDPEDFFLTPLECP